MIIGQTTYAQFKSLRTKAIEADKKCIPVAVKTTEDMLTPVLAYLTLCPNGERSFLYESVVGGEHTSRYSYLGIAPLETITCLGNDVTISGKTGDVKVTNPQVIIANELERYSVLTDPNLPPFTGGLIGNIGYEAVRLIEPTVPEPKHDELGLPDITLMHFDCTIAFDHLYKAIYLIKLIRIDAHRDEQLTSYCEAVKMLQGINEQLNKPRFSDMTRSIKHYCVSQSHTQEKYEQMVKRCKKYIIAGDIFQVVVSQRFSCELGIKPFMLYRYLRQTNPAPFLFFLNFGTWQMVGSSPEILVKVEDRKVTIRPIAGTRKRGATTEEDLALERELQTDEKERAEHIMLVDLARNDVGRVACAGTVQVPTDLYMRVERYSSVMHLVSDVHGLLRDDMSPLDALWASLPAGTLSGAPKVRAMQIIAELENTKRGPYGGCVGFLGYDGNIETAIVIRTAVIKDGIACWNAGGGVVYDSDPTAEFHESQNKGESIKRALKLAGNIKEDSA